VLDSRNDRVLYVDTSGVPRLIASLDLKPQGASPRAAPTSFEIVADDLDPHAIWVLQGPNSRFAGELLGKVSRGLRALLPGTNTQDPSDDASASEPSWPKPLLRRFVLENAAARETAHIDLPGDLLPLHLAQGPSGALWVSGLESDWIHTTLDPVALLKALAKTTDVGRVLEVQPNGQISTRLSGLLAVLQLTTLPGDDTPLYTALRLVPEGFPPGLEVSWVAESYQKSSVKLRAVEWTSLLPPYLPPSVLAQ
jgi:hypothetical protein